jgi:hypothetical protein
VTDVSGRAEDSGYDSAAVLGAVLATIFFPLIALIAALLLQGNEHHPAKRAQLRKWAWLSGGWIAVQAIFFVIIFIAIASSASGLHS